MISDLDLLRAAQLLVNRHGEDTAIVAAQRGAASTLPEGPNGVC